MNQRMIEILRKAPVIAQEILLVMVATLLIFILAVSFVPSEAGAFWEEQDSTQNEPEAQELTSTDPLAEEEVITKSITWTETEKLEKDVSEEDAFDQNAYAQPAIIPDQGMWFLGESFPIAGSLGDGASCPADGAVYTWSSFSNYYCIELVTRAGEVVRGLDYGDSVYINGRHYVVSDIVWNYVNLDPTGSNHLFDYGANGNANGWHYDAIIQTCADYSSPSPLHLWLLTAA